MMLIWWSFQWVVMAAEEMVMPRSCSCFMKSITAWPSWTSPVRWIRPVKNRMRSVVVVLPASIWATMPILRIFCMIACSMFKAPSAIRSDRKDHASTKSMLV